MDVTLTHDAGVNLEVVNTAGAVIAPKRQSNDKTVFALVPGEAYTYVSTKTPGITPQPCSRPPVA
ncbi:MAG: hypothetical protein ACLU9S_22970 [Oscillospiraceae bacterium]